MSQSALWKSLGVIRHTSTITSQINAATRTGPAHRPSWNKVGEGGELTAPHPVRDQREQVNHVREGGRGDDEHEQRIEPEVPPQDESDGQSPTD